MAQEAIAEQRIFVCDVDDMEDGDTKSVDAGSPVAVYRVDGDFFATSDSCTHEQWSLGEEGELDGHEVLCTLHLARFDVRSGAALCFPAMLALKKFQTEVEDGKVYVLPTALAEV
jgi:nitrite reductase/ring-hydroxylating ferredoxin subunit